MKYVELLTAMYGREPDFLNSADPSMLHGVPKMTLDAIKNRLGEPDQLHIDESDRSVSLVYRCEDNSAVITGQIDVDAQGVQTLRDTTVTTVLRRRRDFNCEWLNRDFV